MALSPGQLTWHLRLLRRRLIERDQRWLMLITASQGEGAMKLWRQLDRERKALTTGGEPVAETECGTPLSQEDFERMIREDED